MLKMLYLSVTTFLALVYVRSIVTNTICGTETPKNVPKFYLMEKCHRSKLGIAAKANYTSLTSCRRLGMEKKGLALNFSPPEAATEGQEPLDYTCEVLKCSEADGGLSLTNDSRYDYYSIYAKPFPNVNSTCVPAAGMFHLLENRLNFTEAVAACRNRSGLLADVTSEQRTDVLSQLLIGSSVEVALVGLTRTNNSAFSVVNGDTLDCTTYRAWAPGHPRRYTKKFGCVILTQHRTWQSVPCKARYPVLCELQPGGPYKKGSIFKSLKVEINNATTS